MFTDAQWPFHLLLEFCIEFPIHWFSPKCFPQFAIILSCPLNHHEGCDHCAWTCVTISITWLLSAVFFSSPPLSKSVRCLKESVFWPWSVSLTTCIEWCASSIQVLSLVDISSVLLGGKVQLFFVWYYWVRVLTLCVAMTVMEINLLAKVLLYWTRLSPICGWITWYDPRSFVWISLRVPSLAVRTGSCSWHHDYYHSCPHDLNGLFWCKQVVTVMYS